MIDTAEVYANGKSEEEMCVITTTLAFLFSLSRCESGRVIKELGIRRSDLIITTKVFWGVRQESPNDTGLSRKQ